MLTTIFEKFEKKMRKFDIFWEKNGGVKTENSLFFSIFLNSKIWSKNRVFYYKVDWTIPYDMLTPAQRERQKFKEIWKALDKMIIMVDSWYLIEGSLTFFTHSRPAAALYCANSEMGTVVIIHLSDSQISY